MLGVQTLSKLYSMLGVQTFNKLGFILDGKQSNNHQLNCTVDANTLKNCHHLKKVMVCEHCLANNAVLTQLQNAIHSQAQTLNDIYKK